MKNILSSIAALSVACIGLCFINCPGPNNDNNGSTVDYKSAVDCPSEADIALIDPNAPHVLFPNTNETFHVGKKVEIKWCFPTSYLFSQTRIRLSRDNGRNYSELGIEGQTAGYPVAVPTNTYVWTISDSQTCTQCRIRVQDYDGNVWDVSDSAFSVVP
jgi:hypothetical protein